MGALPLFAQQWAEKQARTRPPNDTDSKPTPDPNTPCAHTTAHCLGSVPLTFKLFADFGEVGHPLQDLWIGSLISMRRLQLTNSDGISF